MAAVYCIKVDEAIVYVGKSNRIEYRVCQHWGQILSKKPKENKYQLLGDCLHRKHKITFWIISRTKEEKTIELENFWIHTLQPCLNSQGNCGKGKELTAQEFYEIIYNQEDEISGMYEYKYKAAKNEEKGMPQTANP